MIYDPIDDETYLEVGDTFSIDGARGIVNKLCREGHYIRFTFGDSMAYSYHGDHGMIFNVTYQWDKRSAHHGELYVVDYPRPGERDSC